MCKPSHYSCKPRCLIFAENVKIVLYFLINWMFFLPVYFFNVEVEILYCMYCFQTSIFQDDEESVIENDSEYETTEEEEIVDGDEEVLPG